MSIITCVEDQRQLAKRKVPKMFYDYADTGSWTETTYKLNEFDLEQIKFRQRVGIDVGNRSTWMSMLKKESPMPTALAPIGMAGMQCADGEILAAKAAENSKCLLLFLPCPFVRLRTWR